MRIAAAVGLAVSLSFAAAPAMPCAVAPPAGQEARVANEEAIIVWDAATKTEQFIRRATFQSTSVKLGFLVPTPTKPTLSEVDQGVFGEVAEAIRPRHETVTEGYDVIWSLLFGLTKGRAASVASVEAAPQAAAAPVRVLEETKVAGMDAVILEADSATALAEWLKTNGFLQTATLDAWLVPYVDAKWKITAFKYGSAAEEANAPPGMFGASAVKLTFQTERPFYPYREPVDARAPLPEKLRNLPQAAPRLLRLYFIGDQRMAGSVGTTPWKAETIYGAAPQEVFGKSKTPLPLDAGKVLTVFHDQQDPRPGTDELWFAPAADQARLEQPPIITREPRMIFVPLELLVPAFAMTLTVWLVLRNRRLRKLAAADTVLHRD